MATKPGILLNANASRVRRDPQLPERLRGLVPAERVKLSSRVEDVAPAVESLLEQGVDSLVLVGGDGTLTGSLTPLLRRFAPESLPAIVPTRGGTVNTIAGSLGALASPEDTLAALLRGSSIREERRAVVRIVPDAALPVFGLIFANGVGVRFLELYYGDSSLGAIGAFSVLARITGSALIGGALARRVFAPFEAELVLDGERIDRRRFTVIAAGGVRHLGLGFAPLRSAGRDPARIHLATTSASPARLALELPALRAGASGSCLSHFSVQRAELRLALPLAWSLDGELFPAARQLEIGAGPALRFVRPGPGTA